MVIEQEGIRRTVIQEMIKELLETAETRRRITLVSYARLLCGRELGHDIRSWEENSYKRVCARCGEWKFYQKKEW